MNYAHVFAISTVFLCIILLLLWSRFDEKLAKLRNRLADTKDYNDGWQAGRQSVMVQPTPQRPKFQETAASSLDEYLERNRHNARTREYIRQHPQPSQPLDPVLDELVSGLAQYHEANSSPEAQRERIAERSRAILASRGAMPIAAYEPGVELPANAIVPALRVEAAQLRPSQHPTIKLLHKRRAKTKSKAKK